MATDFTHAVVYLGPGGGITELAPDAVDIPFDDTDVLGVTTGATQVQAAIEDLDDGLVSIDSRVTALE